MTDYTPTTEALQEAIGKKKFAIAAVREQPKPKGVTTLRAGDGYDHGYNCICEEALKSSPHRTLSAHQAEAIVARIEGGARRLTKT